MIVIPDSCREFIALQRTGYTDLDREFDRDIRIDYERRRRFFPERITRSLDIGCGVCGFDALLYQEHKPEMWLLDKEKRTPIRYGFDNGPSFYNSFHSASQLLEQNGCNRYHFTEEFPKGQFDLIVSLLAWGYHFPLSEYLRQVVDALAPGGVLIIDVREGTDGVAALGAVFREHSCVHIGNKAFTIVCRK